MRCLPPARAHVTSDRGFDLRGRCDGAGAGAAPLCAPAGPAP
eukprot:gene43329-46220_t